MGRQTSLSRVLFISAITFATIFVAMTTSCTRATSNISNTQIAIPQSLSQHMMNSTASTDPTAGQILSHVVINVTALDIPTPIVSIWDSCNGCATVSTPPATFDVNVPQGQNRLIQVIAVYENSTTSAMSVYYGDVTQTLSSSVESATIAVTSVASGTVLNGRVMGRYFTSSTGGPTGRVNVLFDPGNGKQKMLVDHDRIVNGWFHLMVLSGIALTYQVPDTGDILWGGPVSMESLISSNPPSPQVAMAGVPVSLRQQNNNGIITYNPNDAGVFVWGYFANSAATATAAGLSSKAICVDQTPGIQKLKVFTSTAVASAQPLLTLTSGPIPAATGLANITAPMSAITMTGGVANGSGNCASISASALYTNDLPVSTMLIDGNGNDGAAGFRVPFASVPGNFDFAVTPPTSASTTISGQLLPGTDNVIDSVQIYKRVASDKLRIDSPDCTFISAGNLGYVFAGSASVVPPPGITAITTNISAADKATGVSAVLCTSLAGKVYPAGVFIDSSLLKYGTPQLVDGLIASFDNSNIGIGQCHPLTANLTAAGSYNVYNTTMQNISITLTGNTYPLNYYSDSACTSTASMIMIPAGATSGTVYVKGTGVETGTPTLSLVDSSLTPPTSSPISYSIKTASTPTSLSSPTISLSPVQCMDVPLFLQDAAGTTATTASSMNFTVTVPAGLAIVDHCSTQNPVNGFSIPVSAYSGTIGIMTTGTSLPAASTVTISGPLTTSITVYPIP